MELSWDTIKELLNKKNRRKDNSFLKSIHFKINGQHFMLQVIPLEGKPSARNKVIYVPRKKEFVP